MCVCVGVVWGGPGVWVCVCVCGHSVFVHGQCGWAEQGGQWGARSTSRVVEVGGLAENGCSRWKEGGVAWGGCGWSSRRENVAAGAVVAGGGLQGGAPTYAHAIFTPEPLLTRALCDFYPRHSWYPS